MKFYQNLLIYWKLLNQPNLKPANAINFVKPVSMRIVALVNSPNITIKTRFLFFTIKCHSINNLKIIKRKWRKKNTFFLLGILNCFMSSTEELFEWKSWISIGFFFFFLKTNKHNWFSEFYLLFMEKNAYT